MGAPRAQFKFPLDASNSCRRESEERGESRLCPRGGGAFDLVFSRFLFFSRSAPGGAAGSEGRGSQDTPPPRPVPVGRREPGGGSTSGCCCSYYSESVLPPSGLKAQRMLKLVEILVFSPVGCSLLHPSSSLTPTNFLSSLTTSISISYQLFLPVPTPASFNRLNLAFLPFFPKHLTSTVPLMSSFWILMHPGHRQREC